MTIATDTLMAYIDGELSTEEMRTVERGIADRPDLQSYIERQLALRGTLRKAFAEVLDAPLPERLLAAAAKPASLRWRVREAIHSLAARRFVVQSGIPAAAALAFGLLIGVLVTRPDNADIIPVGGNLVARGALAKALSQELASRPTKIAGAKIGVSFRDRTGHYCRTFESTAAVGIACHESGNWQIAALARPESETGSGSTYQPAASPMPDFVRLAVTRMISGAALDESQEREARNRGWERP